MDRQAIKDLMFGGITELMNNRNYFYWSSVGSNYSHFTDEGRQALAEFMEMIGPKMKEAEEKSLDKRAKDLVLKELKTKD